MSIEIPTAEERARLAAPAPTRAAHAELVRRLPCLAQIDAAPPPAPNPPPAALRVVAWNAERGRQPSDAAALLRDAGADAVLLSELDWGMARSGQRHTAREIAAELGFGYAFAVEFLELGTGDAHERAACGDAENEVGFHGGALLCRLPLRDARVVRLETRGDWFGPERDQRRVGGRMAVVARVALARKDVVLASVHLESHGSPEERRDELEVLLAAIDDTAPGGPVLVGGDLNTSSLDPGELSSPERLAGALRANPGRLLDPVPYEPLFASARRRGFAWEGCNRPGTPTHRVPGPDTSTRGGLALDWFLCRGLAATDPEVIAAVDARGRALSDHEAIAVTIA